MDLASTTLLMSSLVEQKNILSDIEPQPTPLSFISSVFDGLDMMLNRVGADVYRPTTNTLLWNGPILALLGRMM